MVSTYPERTQRNLCINDRVVQGLEALTRITVGSLHQAVAHRRDAAMNARLDLSVMKIFCLIRTYCRKLLRRGRQSQTNVCLRRHCRLHCRLTSNVYRSQPAVAAKALKRRSMAATETPSVEASSKKAKTERVTKAVQPSQSVPFRGTGLRNSNR